jgi:hypothetical protein
MQKKWEHKLSKSSKIWCFFMKKDIGWAMAMVMNMRLHHEWSFGLALEIPRPRDMMNLNIRFLLREPMVMMSGIYDWVIGYDDKRLFSIGYNIMIPQLNATSIHSSYYRFTTKSDINSLFHFHSHYHLSLAKYATTCAQLPSWQPPQLPLAPSSHPVASATSPSFPPPIWPSPPSFPL